MGEASTRGVGKLGAVRECCARTNLTKNESIMKSKELLRQLANWYEIANGTGTYTTQSESEDIWANTEEYFKAERVQGELKPDTEYLYFYSYYGSGLQGIQSEVILQDEYLCKIYLYEM